MPKKPFNTLSHLKRATCSVRRAAKAALLFLITTLSSTAINAATLADDRIDFMYHGYDGGGAQIDGPSVLVRKKFNEQVSVRANYYADYVSSASIDVLATASEYTEERTEFSGGIDYLNNKTQMSLNYTQSDESDYNASTVSFGISQEFFGDLTTLSMGYAVGNDTVKQNGNDTFEEEVERQQFNLTLTQIISKSFIVSLGFESVIDEGFLNNPYRQARYLDASEPLGFAYQQEVYPNTRNSDAIAIRGLYYLPWNAALRGEYRYFSDSWGIEADTAEIAYIHPWKHGLTFELKYRNYSQTAATFYSDLFAFQNAQNFMARDKELSTFTNNTVGIGVSYELPFKMWGFAKKSSVNLFWDHMIFDYDDFRDVTAGGLPGEEEFYSFDADVIRLFFSVWY